MKEHFLTARDYDLASTLGSGRPSMGIQSGAWEGVNGQHWVRLSQMAGGIHAERRLPVQDWTGSLTICN